MTLFRPHRMFLDEALAEKFEVSSKAVLETILNFKHLTIEKYGKGIDKRCGWDTHIVTDEDGHIVGFTDGDLK